MENTQAQPIVIKSGSGMGVGGTVISLAALAALVYGGYKLVKQGKENSAEAQLDTEAGQIASELKVVFDSTFVDKAAYSRIALRINSTNKDDVYKIYRKLSGRNLSDDETRLPSDVKEKSQKIQTYNNKPGKLFSITSDNSIKFEVIKGDFVRFQPGQTTPITAYNSAFGIVLNELKNPLLNSKLKSDPKTSALTVSIAIKPNSKVYKVVQTKEVPVSDLKKSEGFWKYVKPLVQTRKVFAAVQIIIGINATTKKPVLVWIDARDMVTFKPQVKGIGSINLIS